MGLIDFLDGIFFCGEDVNRCKNGKQTSSEYLHPSYRKNREDAELYRIKLNQENQHSLKISKMLEEIEKKETIARDKQGSILALESLPEIIKAEIVKKTGLPLDRLKEYSYEVDHDFYTGPLDSAGRHFWIAESEEEHPKYRGSSVYFGWRCEYLENKEGKPFLRIQPYKSGN